MERKREEERGTREEVDLEEEEKGGEAPLRPRPEGPRGEGPCLSAPAHITAYITLGSYTILGSYIILGWSYIMLGSDIMESVLKQHKTQVELHNAGFSHHGISHKY